jgi:hypothetical protein
MAHPTSGRNGFRSIEPKIQINSPICEEAIICDGCRNTIEGIRYKCSTCPSHDLCERCIIKNDNSSHPTMNSSDESGVVSEFGNQTSTNTHSSDGAHGPGHLFLRVMMRNQAPPNPPILSNRSQWTHEGVSCVTCQGEVVGYRYFCTVCGTSLCESCEQLGSHDVTHSLLKMPSDR